MSLHVESMSKPGREWLAALEGGYRQDAYQDSAGIWTLGAGNTRWPDGRRVQKGDHWTPEQCRLSFAITIAAFEDVVDAATRDDLTQMQFDALTAFCYNVGPAAFRSSTLVKLVNARALDQAVRDQFCRWRYADEDPTHPGLEESPGLLARRRAEADAYCGLSYHLQEHA